jgi:hypothetical protein
MNSAGLGKLLNCVQIIIIADRYFLRKRSNPGLFVFMKEKSLGCCADRVIVSARTCSLAPFPISRIFFILPGLLTSALIKFPYRGGINIGKNVLSQSNPYEMIFIFLFKFIGILTGNAFLLEFRLEIGKRLCFSLISKIGIRLEG